MSLVSYHFSILLSEARLIITVQVGANLQVSPKKSTSVEKQSKFKKLGFERAFIYLPGRPGLEAVISLMSKITRLRSYKTSAIPNERSELLFFFEN